MSGLVCPSCDAPLTGRFCAQCGEEQPHEVPTVAHVLHDLTHEVLHLDGKIFKTAIALVAQPGYLTLEYWASRKTKWVRPLRVLLTVIAVHYFAAPGIGPLNMDVTLHRSASGDLNVAIGPRASERLGEPQNVPEAERVAYRDKLRKVYSPIRYLAVPLFALASLALYRRSQPYYAHHLVLAAHVYSLWYLVGILIAFIGPGWLSTATMWLGYWLLFKSLQRIFPNSRRQTLLRTTALFAIMLFTELLLAFAAGAWVGSGK